MIILRKEVRVRKEIRNSNRSSEANEFTIDYYILFLEECFRNLESDGNSITKRMKEFRQNTVRLRHSQIQKFSEVIFGDRYPKASKRNRHRSAPGFRITPVLGIHFITKTSRRAQNRLQRSKSS